jgi:hypothetical protein
MVHFKCMWHALAMDTQPIPKKFQNAINPTKIYQSSISSARWCSPRAIARSLRLLKLGWMMLDRDMNMPVITQKILFTDWKANLSQAFAQRLDFRSGDILRHDEVSIGLSRILAEYADRHIATWSDRALSHVAVEALEAKRSAPFMLVSYGASASQTWTAFGCRLRNHARYSLPLKERMLNTMLSLQAS